MSSRATPSAVAFTSSCATAFAFRIAASSACSPRLVRSSAAPCKAPDSSNETMTSTGPCSIASATDCASRPSATSCWSWPATGSCACARAGRVTASRAITATRKLKPRAKGALMRKPPDWALTASLPRAAAGVAPGSKERRTRGGYALTLPIGGLRPSVAPSGAFWGRCGDDAGVSPQGTARKPSTPALRMSRGRLRLR